MTLSKLSKYQSQVDKYLASELTDMRPEVERVVKKAIAAKDRYESVAKTTGFPWYVIAMFHRRERDQNWKAVLHNGELIIGTGEKTKLVPKGRGPFVTWEGAAIDALKDAWKPKAWDLGSVIECGERYNGLGYRNNNHISPYVWDGTTAYTKGLFGRDGKYDPEKVEDRPGIAAMLKIFVELKEIELV